MYGLLYWSISSREAVQAPCCALLTHFLRTLITSAGSGAPNMELPATMQLAPAEAAISMVEGPKPPSTCLVKGVQ